jgi:hypothetical protein
MAKGQVSFASRVMTALFDSWAIWDGRWSRAGLAFKGTIERARFVRGCTRAAFARAGPL